MSDFLLLKWGTIKGYNFECSPKAFEALKKWGELGVSMSAMTQDNTQEQKKLICKMIDNVNGPITNDWSGKKLSKSAAKKYVMEYGTTKR